MMIAVVVDASKPGVSGWSAVRSTQLLQVRGLVQGDVEIIFNTGEHPLFCTDSCEIAIPKDATRVKVRIIDPGEGRVFVDLE